MKKIALILLLAMGFINANAQSTTTPIDLRIPSATLQKASDHMLSGVLLTTVGAVLMGIGNNHHEPLIYIGGGCVALGLGFTISGIKKLGLAGRQLNVIK